MTAPVKNLKARQKAAPDRIQQAIARSSVFINGEFVDNQIVHLAEHDDANHHLEQLLEVNQVGAAQAVSVPAECWLNHYNDLQNDVRLAGVQLAGDQDTQILAGTLPAIKMIVLPMVNFVDGRAYSQVYQLRKQMRFAGEIRVTGDVHYDQLNFLSRVGVNAFELPDDTDKSVVHQAFTEFRDAYQPSTDNHRLVFHRRRN